VKSGPPQVWDVSAGARRLLPPPGRDEITKAYE